VIRLIVAALVLAGWVSVDPTSPIAWTFGLVMAFGILSVRTGKKPGPARARR
jgi:hypothetical protein